MSVLLREYKPSSTLQPYVESFWEGSFNMEDAGLLAQRVVPNGYLELVIHLTDEHCQLLQDASYAASSDYTLIGLFTQPYEVRFPAMVKVFGIRFKPEGVYPVFGIPAAAILEQTTDLENTSGRRFREFCHRLRALKTVESMLHLSEQFLEGQLQLQDMTLYYLHHAAEQIRRAKGQINMDDLARCVYISPRQLEREFKQKIGLTPKGYMRIARLNEANRLLESGFEMSLTSLAYASGYTDQAHFIREFKTFTGVNPTAFLRRREQFMVNGTLGRSA